MEIRTKAQHAKAAEKVFALMNKGEKNLTRKEQAEVLRTAKAIQTYERKLHPPTEPKTLYGMVERKMYEKRLTQLALAKKLNVSATKFSMIMNGKQKPDVAFLKRIRRELNISADFILDNV